MSPEKLAAWRAELEPTAWELARKLVPGKPFDLVAEFAGPWSLTAAALVNGVKREGAEGLAALAADVFAGADDPYDSDRQARADIAVTELARSLEGPLAVQSFVALCQSLECFLAGAWLALLNAPDQLDRLRTQPDLMPNAIEELLRFAGPSRAQFRRASATVDIAGVTIQRGERVILMLAAANRDPAKFPEPDRLEIGRSAAGHLAFGVGTHACAGAPLVRMAASVATAVLVSHLGPAEVIEVQWRDGFAIRGPRSLKIVVQI